MDKKVWVPFYMTAGPVAVGVSAAATLGPVAALIALTGALVLILGAARPSALIAPLILGAIVLMRPSWLGQDYTPIGVTLVVAAGLLSVLEDRMSDRRHVVNLGSRSLLIWVGLLSAWLCIIPAIHTSAPLDYLRSALYVVLTLAAGILVLRDPERASRLARAVVWLSVAFCVSFLLTLLWWVAHGPLTGELLRVHIPGYVGMSAQPVFLPFTPTSAVTVIGGVPFPRLLGYMREPGLFQAVLLWSFFMVNPLRMHRTRLVYGLLLLGIAGTQSTAGFAIFLAVAVLTKFVIRKDSHGGPEVVLWRLLGIVIALIAVWVAIKAPVLGVDAKRHINAGSISDRSANAWAGLTSLGTHPFGQNLYGASAVRFSGINLLASSILIGAPGLLLGLMAYFRPIFLAPNRVRVAKLILPIGLTALAAQPVTGAPAFWLLCLIALCLDPAAPCGTKSAGDHPRRGFIGFGLSEPDPQGPTGRVTAMTVSLQRSRLSRPSWIAQCSPTVKGNRVPAKLKLRARHAVTHR